MLIDALVLAGGRSSRLDFIPKAELIFLGQSLLDRAVSAVSFARSVVVVGPPPSTPLPVHAIVAREDPPFGGPAAAIAAGVDALAASDSEPSLYTIVLACDMPRIESAVVALVDALAGAGLSDGVIAVDGERQLQPLAAAYNSGKLAVAIDRYRRAGALDGLSVFQLIRELRLIEVPIPKHATDDIDTWGDVERFGITRPTVTTTEEKQ